MPFRVSPLVTPALAPLAVRSKGPLTVTAFSVPPDEVHINPCPPLPGRTVAPARVPPLSENVLSTSAVVLTVKVPAVIWNEASLRSDWTVMLEAEVIVSEAKEDGI